MDDLQIIPAVLATSEAEYRDKLNNIESSGVFNGGWIQVDIMDGLFVSNRSVDAQVVAKYPTSFSLEAHLMVEDPVKWSDELIKAGVKRVIFPVETKADINALLDSLHAQGLETGLSVNPQTPVEKLAPFIDKIDSALIMSVEPGFGGQVFIPGATAKIKELVKLRGEKNVIIEVDGGINESNIKEVASAGAGRAAIGEHLTNGDIAENLEKIWQALVG